MNDQTKPAAAANKKKKKGTIKRIRGFLTGESRKQRRERKAKELAAAGAGAHEAFPVDDDAESVYGVNIDNMSVSGTPNRDSVLGSSLLMEPKSEESEYGDEIIPPQEPATPPGKPPDTTPPGTPQSLQVILLLMDPQTRRFELLQLEFDSYKALAADVLLQIPLAVTDEELRNQTYRGVCDRSGLEMIKTVRLSEFCKTNDVILAIPEGMVAEECAHLARPILSDGGVISMLRASGIDAEPVPLSPVEERDIELSVPTEENLTEGKTSGSSASLIVVVVIAILLQTAQLYITSPLKPGHVLEPGMWMSKCGLLSPLPVCQNSGLEMNEDGVLTLYGSDGSVEWRLVGGKCRPDTDCVPGLVVQDDGNLVIGGKAITSVTVKGDNPAPLTPWPFQVEPKLRVVRK